MTRGAMGSTAVRVAWQRRASREDREREIFRSLGLVLRERGLASLTMQDIARRLGLTKGNLYYYFRDKQDLLYKCHLACMRVSLDALAGSHRGRESAAERLRTVLQKHIRAITDEVYGAVLLTDLESLTPLQRRRYVAMRDTFERGVRALIRRGVETRQFRPVDPRLAGFIILGAINWIPKWWRPDGPLSPKTLAEVFAAQLVRMLEVR